MKRKLAWAIAIVLPLVLLAMLREAASWRPQVLGQGKRGTALSVSTDGLRLLEGGHLWDLPAEKGIALNKERFCFTFAVDSRTFMCLNRTGPIGYGSTPSIISIEEGSSKNGQLMRRIQGEICEYQESAQVGYSPDKQNIWLFSNREMRTYRWRDGRMLRRMRWPIPSNSHECDEVALSPDGTRFLVAVVDWGILFFDASTGKLLKKLPAAPDRVLNLAISPDNRLGFVNDQDDVGDIRSGFNMRDLKTGRNLWKSTRQQAAAFSPDSQQVATLNDDSTLLILREAWTGKILRRYPGLTQSGLLELTWTPDGRFIIASDRKGTLWKIRAH